MSSGNKVQSWNDGGVLELQQRKGCLFPGAGIGYSRKAGEGSDWKFIAVSIQSPGSVFHSKEKQECVFTGREKFGLWFWENFPCFPARFEGRKRESCLGWWHGNLGALPRTWVFPFVGKASSRTMENIQDAEGGAEPLVPWKCLHRLDLSMVMELSL